MMLGMWRLLGVNIASALATVRSIEFTSQIDPSANPLALRLTETLTHTFLPLVMFNHPPSDNGSPKVRFGEATYRVDEGAGAATLVVTLSTASPVSVTVDYATSDPSLRRRTVRPRSVQAAGSGQASAEAGEDYTAISGTLSFASGQTSQTVTVTINDDSFDEPDETLTLTLSNPVNAVLGTPCTATLIIADDDELPTVQFSGHSYGVGEGAGTATIIVTLSGASAVPVAVDYATADPAGDSGQAPAKAGDDYAVVSGTLSFAPGQTSRTFTVTIHNDTFDEPDETLALTLSSPVNAALGIPHTATLTIVDDDETPTVQFGGTTYSIGEKAGTATIIATLSGASAVSVTVDYVTSDGTAGAGSDYTTISGTLSFAPGQTSQSFTVTILDDELDEPDETLTLTLSNPVNAALGAPCIATLTVVDDDVPPTVQFGSATYSVGERAGTATIIATLSAPSWQTVTVDYATSAPSTGSGQAPAEVGSDYIAISGTLSFAPGQTSQSFTVTILDDGLDEPDETLALALSNPIHAALGTPHTATLTIVDNTLLTVQFSSVAYSVGEGAGMATINATLSAPSWQTVTVDYTTSDPSLRRRTVRPRSVQATGSGQVPATAGDDYMATSGTLSFVPGQTSQSFTVMILDDVIDELDETLMLTLRDPVSATLGMPYTATLTIVDNDVPPIVRFSGAMYNVGEEADTATVIVALSAPSWQTVTVDYATSDPSTGSGQAPATADDDYTATSGTLSFAPGQTSQSFTVTILDDEFDEPDETLTLILSNPVSATLGTPPTATLTIVDDDTPPTVQFNSDSYNVGEGAGAATVIATLSAASTVPVMVDYATSDGTAEAGSDYTAASGTLSFAPGQTSQSFSVTILDDELDEQDEMLILTLSNPVNVTLGAPSTATLTIVDNDGAPMVQFSSATYSIGEGAGTATVVATLSSASAVSVTVDYATSDGTAEAGDDYTTASGTLSFAPGQTSQSFAVTILDDELGEPDETLTLALSNPVNAMLGAPSTATLIIKDSTLLTVQFSSDDLDVGENAGAATIIATLSAVSTLSVTVDYATSDRTAEAGSDYVASSSTLSFAPGQTSQSFAVTILDDGLDEPDETLTLALSNPVNATLGAPSAATLTIVDDDEPPTVQFSGATYSIGEGAGTATVVATLSGASAVPVTVDYATSDGTAEAGSDYTATSSALTFNPGVTSQSFTVTILDDELDESNEILTFTLSNPVNATLGAPSAATLTIVDDDEAPTVQFGSATYSVGEGAGAATINATLSAASAVLITVDYATSDGTAEAGDDYTAISGTLSFAPGQTNQSFAVTILDDELDEPDETFIFTLSNPVNATLGTPYTATLTVVDDDEPPTVQFGSATYSVGEGAGAATLNATLSAASAVSVTVDYATTDGTAEKDSDYVAVSGTLSFAPGQTNQSFAVAILDDELDEPDETLTFTLSNPASATLGTPSTATLTIVDNDEPPTVQFGSATYSVGEGAGTATINATLSAASAVPVTVDYDASDGTAEAGDDYTAIGGTLSFAPGQTNQSFAVAILDDALDEPDETLTFTLSNPVNATLGTPSTATLTIVDDDEPPTVQFGSATYSVGEGVGTATVIATLSAASAVLVTVDYATSDGTAKAPDDYTAASGTLSFAPGQTSRSFAVTILDDALDELDETFTLTLSNPVNATLGTPSAATLTIVDNDAPPTVQFSNAAYNVSEGAGTATIHATLSAASWYTIAVNYDATSDGTAKSPDDYTAASGTLVFTPGDTSETFEVTIHEDTFDEPDETIMLVLSDPVSATLGAPHAATLTILDNDAPPGTSSPFALQVAALHQVTPNTMMLKDGTLASPQSEAELLTLYEATFAKVTDALRQSGAGWARVRIEWEMIEPDPPEPGEPPDYVWGPYHDVKLRLVAEAGVRLIGTIVDAPSWAASVPCAPIYADRLDEFAQFLTDLVNRYKGPPYNIKHWELINEPDYTKSNGHTGGLGCWGYDGDKYAQMLAVAYPAIKAADPGATVLMGGVAHDWLTEVGGPFYRYFPDNVMASGGGAYVDVINFHYFPDFHAEWERWDPSSPDRRYGWLPAPTCGDIYDGAGTKYEAWGVDLVAKTTHFRNRMSACFGVNKPVWITELAEHGYPGDSSSLANQARYVIKGYTRGLAAGARNITWYSLDRPPYDPYYQSLLYDDFSPKPAFVAYQTLVAELTGYGYSHDRNTCQWVNCAVEAYVFESSSLQKKTVAWGSGTLVFALADQLRVVNRQGSVTTVVDGGEGDVDGAQNGSVELQLSVEPVFVKVVAGG